jgi:hypothetical protein
MPRGYDVLKNPSMYSKKRLDRALKRKARREASSGGGNNAALTRSAPLAEIKKVSRYEVMSYHDGVYRVGGMRIDMFDAENAAEVVRRFNACDK